MTFRMDDLLIDVLPRDQEMKKDKGDCGKCTLCTNDTGPPSPCTDVNSGCCGAPAAGPAPPTCTLKKASLSQGSELDALLAELEMELATV